MRILIVVPSQDRISGNWITAGRFMHGLEDQGHQVALHATSLQPRQLLYDFNPDVALLLHACRSGKPWMEEAAELIAILLEATNASHRGLCSSAVPSPINRILFS